MPTFSVIIPTYNRPAALAECLASLAALDYPRDRFEVIVVDDGGAGDLTAVVQRFSDTIDVKCIRQSNAGPAAARNAGAAQAGGAFLAFTDDDCHPRRDWMRQLATQLEEDRDVLVGGRTQNGLPDNLCATASQSILDVVNTHFNRDHQHAVFFPSNNIALPRDRYLELGGFDPAFRCSEDRDLCDRWAARGWRLVFAPDAVVDHARRMNLRGFWKQHFGYGRGAWRFHRAREKRRTGKLEVEGGFYAKCFREPFRTLPTGKALSVAALLVAWQIANTAGFFYEAAVSSRAGVKDGRSCPSNTDKPSNPPGKTSQNPT